MTKEFKIVYDYTINEFEKKMQKLSEEGFVPVGGISLGGSHTSHVSCLMVRDTTGEPSNTELHLAAEMARLEKENTALRNFLRDALNDRPSVVFCPFKKLPYQVTLKINNMLILVGNDQNSLSQEEHIDMTISTVIRDIAESKLEWVNNNENN